MNAPQSKIICGNNSDILKGFPPDCIDLTVTSPPYDNLRDYEGYKWDFDIVAMELFRITKPGGVVVWIVGDATMEGSETGTSFRQALTFKDIGFKLYDTMIWHKTGYPKNDQRYEPAFEYMFVLSKGMPKTFNGIRDKPNKWAGDVARVGHRGKDNVVRKTSSYRKNKIAKLGLRTNVWNIPAAKKRNERLHPAPFSIRLAQDHIRTWTNVGDIVLDPFNGSGTTCKAAYEIERKYIGVEISQKYCQIAKRRLAKSFIRPDLGFLQ